jgi:transcriptional regulator with XRE-family HTH domain
VILLDQLGIKIKELRLQKRISQEKLAKGICDRSLISRLEKGYLIPSAEILYKVSLKLGIPLGELLHLVRYSNYDYLKEFMYWTRKAVERRNYEEVKQHLQATSKSPEFQTGIAKAFVLWHRGIVINYINNNPEQAHEVLQEALGTLQDIEHFDGQVMEIEILNTIANIYLSQNKHESAKNYYLKAEELITNLPFMNLSELKIRINYNLSVLYLKLDKYDKSLEHCKVGLKECKQVNSMYSLGELYYHQGLSKALLGLENYINDFEYALTIFEIQENQPFYDYVKEKKEKYVSGDSEVLNK